MTVTPGYSGKPLHQKLGLAPGMRCRIINPPGDYAALLDGASAAIDLHAKPRSNVDFAHVFVTERTELAKHLKQLPGMLQPAGMIWVSWPKKTSKVPTNITEDTIREIALPLGLVDVKVCAVSDVWSGLKLVIRKDRRSPA